MTEPTDRQPAIGWYETGRPIVCCWLYSRDHYRPDCRKQLPPGTRVLVTGPVRGYPKGLVLCEPCGQAFLDGYLEPGVQDELVERCRVWSDAWQLDIDLALGRGPLIREEAS